ncbi:MULTISPECIES: RNA polymerase sigma factor SigJ [Microbacterium]|uniref:RNA polymerase sigma factor SigJ n=1 Tax=Microbacterium TaxID=33882 RepID=UPI00210ACD5D|nr:MULTISPECIES: RNA polymerase sigma factor SigJ [unclassified Microbacterium]MDT3346004.1 RNA polymerase sigma factor SigJ [Microbacterium sp. KSW2-22]
MRPGTEIVMTDAATRRIGDVDAYRRTLVAAAYRMLGTLADAEDAAQEAYVRWLRLDAGEREAIENPGGWLMRVTGRICLDVLGSARVRHETYVGEWLPETIPVGTASGDPAAVVVGAEEVSTALLLVLETLTPAERVAFVLHEVFAVPFAEIAGVLGRSAAACRQLAASARRHVGRRAGAGVPRSRHDELIAAFAAASASGSLDALVRVLAPDVVLVSDGGGIVSAARRPVRGADHVARFLLGLAAKQPTATYEPAITGDGLGYAIRVDGVIVAAVTFATDGERITDVWMMRNPEKLSAWV